MLQREKEKNGDNGDDDVETEMEDQYTSDESPPVSPTRDIYSHDTSPNDEDDQCSIYEPLSRNVSRR